MRLILLSGHIALADRYADALQSYELHEHRQALQMFGRLANTGDAKAQ